MDKITINLITNRVRQVAEKIKNRERLTSEDRTFAANALNDFAGRIERRSIGSAKTENKTNAAKIQQVSARKIQRKYDELCGNPQS